MNEPEAGRGPLAEELRISVARLSRRLRREGGNTLSVTQFAALAALERHGEMTPRRLADHEKVQPPSMTRTLAALEAAGLVTRRPHPADRRQVVLAVTEDGREQLAGQRRRKEAWLARHLRELTPRELAVLEEAAPILERLSRST